MHTRLRNDNTDDDDDDDRQTNKYENDGSSKIHL